MEEEISYRSLTKTTIYILNEILTVKIELKEELNEINNKVRGKYILRKGEWVVKAKNEVEQMNIISLLREKEKIEYMNSLLPLEGTLKKVVNCLENQIFISDKMFNELKKLAVDEDGDYEYLFTIVINHNNILANINKLYENFLADIKQKSVNNSVIPKVTDTAAPIEKIIPVENQIEEEIIIESKEEISSLALYYFQLLESTDYHNIIKEELMEKVKENDYKCIKNFKFLIEEKLLSCLPEENEYLKQGLAIINDVLTASNQEYIEIIEPNIEYENQIYLAPKNSERIYIEEDMKNIPIEYYDSIYKLLNAIKTNNFNGIDTRKITNNNNFENLLELKIFKVRLFYRLLGSNNIQLIMLSMKKSDSDKLLLSKMEVRCANTNQNYINLKNRISNNQITKEDLELEEINYQRILNKVSKKNRSI